VALQLCSERYASHTATDRREAGRAEPEDDDDCMTDRLGEEDRREFEFRRGEGERL
jgi:hypothetical protein